MRGRSFVRVVAKEGSRPPGADASFAEYYRCSDAVFQSESGSAATADAGYFTFDGSVCYGRPFRGTTAPYIDGQPLPEVPMDVPAPSALARLPLDLSEVVTNLRRERYRRVPPRAESIAGSSSARSLYYAVRPMLGVAVRKHFQRLRLAGWNTIPFPRWPVDATVDALMRSAMKRALRANDACRIPFIWFWPDGADAAVMMTHDVEGERGLSYCDALMDLDESFGIPSSFQIVPTFDASDICAEVQRRGFEVNLHDWNHDGRLFHDKRLFLERAALINAYARRLGCRGFRSAVMYREQDWFDALEFDYDMSVPNVAHLDPQRGGCCTVMPYFIGDILELPLTTIQDYSLLHVIGDYSIALWQKQIDLILAEHGLVSFIVHPDYVNTKRENQVYVRLLEHLDELRARKRLWVAAPGEIEQWWRHRHEMRLVRDDAGWRVSGADSARARVAYATLDGNCVSYQVEDDTPQEAPAAS